VKLRVAAGEPDEVGGSVGRFVGEGREGQDLGPRPAPAFEDMGVGEGEGRVLRQRDLLRGRAREGAGCGGRAALCRPADGGDVDVIAQERRVARDGGLEVRVLHRLDQAQVPLRQRQVAPARQRAEDGDARALHPEPGEALVPGARHAVQDDAGEREVGVVGGEAQRGRRRRLRLTAHVEDEDHGPAHRLRGLGARPPAGEAARRDAVEEAHRAFRHAEVGPPRLPASAPMRPGPIAQVSRLNDARPQAARWKAGSM
jgi:hypothetical protein